MKKSTERAMLLRDILVLERKAGDLTKEIEDIMSRTRMEVKEAKHDAKMRKEELELEYSTLMDMERKEHQKEITKLQKDYYEKMMTTIREVYLEILKRLPNVNVEVRK